MKALRVFALVVGLSAIVTLPTLVAPTHSVAQSGRGIYGELVAEGGNTFRIVGHSGHYKAPSGTPLTALDGKTVQVDIDSSGRVVSIAEAPVPVNPVAHGWSVVRGVVKVTDPLNRRFTFAGDTEMYSAPPSIDIMPYDGRMAEVKLDQTGRVAEMKLVSPPPQSGYYAPQPGSDYTAPSGTGYTAPPAGTGYSEPATGYGVPATGCMYEGQTYSTGAAVCQSGTQYRCDGTHWQSLGTNCRVVGASDAPPRDPASCAIGDATVAPGSSICRSGTTYRCDDGTWVNVRTPCR
jgi:hypothetical protein